MGMKFRWALTGFIGIAAVLCISCTTSNSNGVSGRGFLWVTTQGNQMLSAYNIDLNSGAATQVGSSVPTGLGPIALAMTPNGSALFVANRDDNTISAYGVNSDGSIPTPCPSPKPANCNTIAAGPVAGSPVALAIDPAGKFLFVANQASQAVFLPPNTPDTIAVFSINGPALTSVGFFASTGNGPSALAASPTGSFLYVANEFTSTVSILSYDASGTLTEDLGSPVTVGTNPGGLAFSRCAGTTSNATSITCPTAAPPNYLFVANSASNNISVFTACIQVNTACPSADGTLVQSGAAVGSSGTSPVSFIIDPALDFVYVVDGGSFQVSQYKYGPATGTLTALSPSTMSTGASPVSGGITGDGNWVFVPNNGGSSISGYSLKTATGTTPTGLLTVGTAITLQGQPSAVLIR